MNNYCKHLKKRKNKPYCNVIRKEIAFSCCQECVNKEYKKNTTFSQNSANTQNKNGKCTKTTKMKNKSKKLAKMERDRFSVFTDNDKCFVCKSTYQLTWHEIYAGRNRRNSMIYGFCLRMCLNCHEEKQEDIKFNEFWHRQAQLFFEENIGTRDEFLSIFRRNYLE